MPAHDHPFHGEHIGGNLRQRRIAGRGLLHGEQIDHSRAKGHEADEQQQSLHRSPRGLEARETFYTRQECVLFTGEYEYTIDAKGRLAIPAEIRSWLDPQKGGCGFYITAGPNDALWLWPERTFERIAGAIEESLLQTEEQIEFDEITFPSARHLEMDKSGRVLLPQKMIETAGIGSKVMILGMRDHLELRLPSL